jgi:hypothetical protein
MINSPLVVVGVIGIMVLVTIVRCLAASVREVNRWDKP